MKARGFTLLELLVALAVFTVMAGFAYRGLNAVLDTRLRLAADTQRLREVALLFDRLEDDLGNATIRPIRDAGDQTAPPFVAGTEALGESDALMAFTRMGLAGQTGVLAGLQRFGYRLRGRTVELLTWPVLDFGPRTLPTVTPILGDVAGFELRYLDGSGNWQPRWRKSEQQADFPNAVEATLILASGERIVRLFLLPALSSG